MSITAQDLDAANKGDYAARQRVNAAVIARAHRTGEKAQEAREKLVEMIRLEGREISEGEPMPPTNLTLAEFKNAASNGQASQKLDVLVRRRLMRDPKSSYRAQVRAIGEELRADRPASPAPPSVAASAIDARVPPRAIASPTFGAPSGVMSGASGLAKIREILSSVVESQKKGLAVPLSAPAAEALAEALTAAAIRLDRRTVAQIESLVNTARAGGEARTGFHVVTRALAAVDRQLGRISPEAA